MKFKVFCLVSLLILGSLSMVFAGGQQEAAEESAAPAATTEKAAAPAAVPVDTGKTYTLKFSWSDPVDPLKQSTSGYALVFKQELERLSGGRIKVELYPSGQLGDQRSSTEQVAQGTIQACNISSGVLASLYYPKLEIVDMPFLFSSRAHAAEFLDVNDNPFMADMAKDVAKETGIKLLNVIPFGYRNLTNNVREIRTPADVKGLKIRTMEVTPHMKLIEALGGSPTPIPFLEVYTSLQTNVVDGQENPPQIIEVMHFYEVQKYMTMTGHVMGVGATLMNDEWYQALPADLKAAVTEADATASLVYNGLGQVLDATCAESLIEAGLQIYNPTPEERQAFKDATQPYVREYMVDQLGAEFVDGFLAAVEATAQEFADEAVR